MMSHRHYLPSVGFGMTQRCLDLFIWMPSSFHFYAPYAEFIWLSTDNHADNFVCAAACLKPLYSGNIMENHGRGAAKNVMQGRATRPTLP